MRADPPVFHHRDFDPARLADAKHGRTVSVCLPARNEEATIGPIVDTIRHELVDDAGLVDELLVIDDHSTDGTAEAAVGAGAKVVDAGAILPTYGDGHGKGEALWKSVYAAEGDLLVWCDADIVDFRAHIITGLLGPLLERDDIVFVKGFYDRPVDEHGNGGGRVTELVARPMLSLFFPHLAPLVQPLAGEYACRREVAESMPFVHGYGVDIALLIDVAERYGADALAQVDLDQRVDRNRTLDELSPQAMAIVQTVLRRADAGPRRTSATLHRPGHPPVEVDVSEHPPLLEVDAYRRVRRAG